jgi:uncharacterized protein
VRAGQAVWASDGIVRSSIEAGTTVEVLGQHGTILGGRVVARESVSARDLGSAHGIATELVVGSAPAVVAEAQDIRMRLPELVRQLGLVQQRLALLQEHGRQGRPHVHGRLELERFHDVYQSLLNERTVLLARQLVVIDTLQALSGAIVRAQGTCYAGVKVHIGSGTWMTSDPLIGVRFQRNASSGEIETIGLAVR